MLEVLKKWITSGWIIIRNTGGLCWPSGRVQKAYSTWYSQAVSHPSTNQARPCLVSEIGRDRAFSGWYGRKREQVQENGLLKLIHSNLFSWNIYSAGDCPFCFVTVQTSMLEQPPIHSPQKEKAIQWSLAISRFIFRGFADFFCESFIAVLKYNRRWHIRL